MLNLVYAPISSNFMFASSMDCTLSFHIKNDDGSTEEGKCYLHFNDLEIVNVGLRLYLKSLCWPLWKVRDAIFIETEDEFLMNSLGKIIHKGKVLLKVLRMCWFFALLRFVCAFYLRMLNAFAFGLMILQIYHFNELLHFSISFHNNAWVSK